jgi:hypothetical protein
MPSQYSSSFEQEAAANLLICGWGTSEFGWSLLEELSNGPECLPPGSCVTLANMHDLLGGQGEPLLLKRIRTTRSVGIDAGDLNAHFFYILEPFQGLVGHPWDCSWAWLPGMGLAAWHGPGCLAWAWLLAGKMVSLWCCSSLGYLCFRNAALPTSISATAPSGLPSAQEHARQEEGMEAVP